MTLGTHVRLHVIFHTRTGGSLGWKTRGSLLADFEKVAYELQPSSANKPVIGEVRTTEGYHLVMVEGRR